MKKNIKQAIEKDLLIWWQRRGLYGLQLRAVTYTWENGRERTKCLQEFSDIRVELNDAVKLHKTIRAIAGSCSLRDAQFKGVLRAAWYDIGFPVPEFLKEEI